MKMLKKLVLTGMLALSATTVFAASFDQLDNNGDNTITKDEYFGSISDWGTYSDWDVNGDGLIDESEFDDGPFDGTYTYYDYNNDGYLDSYELYDGVYTSYDANDDGIWNDNEWNMFNEAGFLN
tara:strand:+ start:673 stop:1044 length:372 start_codon:yes stop_codon:yes gene_type:complete